MLWFYYVVVIIILLFISFMFMFYDWKWVWNFYRYRKLPLIKMTPIVGVGLDLLKHREEGKIVKYLESLSPIIFS